MKQKEEAQKEDQVKAASFGILIKKAGKGVRDVSGALEKIPLKEANYKLTKKDKIFSHFASAAYHKNPEPIYGYHLDKKLSTEHSQVWMKKDKVILSFRGTTNKADLKTDLKIISKSRDDKRFKEAVILTNKLISNGKKKKNISITGHSLGGTIGRYVSSQTGIKNGAVFNAGASPFEINGHVDKNVKLKTIISNLDPISHSLIGGKNVHVTLPPKGVAHVHAIEGVHDSSGRVKPNYQNIKSKTTPHSSGLVNALENTQYGTAKVNTANTNWSKIQQSSAQIGGKASIIISRAGNTAATIIKIGAAAATMVSSIILVVDGLYETLHFFYNVIDFNAQKKEEADVNNWAAHYNFISKVDAFIKYTWSSRKIENSSTASTSFTPLEEVKKWWGPIQPGDHPDYHGDLKNTFRNYKGRRIPRVEALDSLRKDPNNLHYVFMDEGKFNAEKSKYPEYQKYILVQSRPESYKLVAETKFLPVYISYYDKQNLYYIPPETVNDTANKVLRYIEIPTILMNTEEESVYKFRFQRHPKDEFLLGVYKGGTFDYETNSLISGQPGIQNYYDWLTIPSNQASYGIYSLWKTSYANISFANIKQAFADPNNPPTLEELKIMNDQKVSQADAQAVVAKENSAETLQLKQTAELLEAEKLKLTTYLNEKASDPQSVFTFLNNEGMQYGGWTENSWEVLWQHYNLWRESKGLAPVVRNGEVGEKMNQQPSMTSNGSLLMPTGSSLSSLYKSQNALYERQWRIIL
jgi:hypothetical protein